MNENETQKTRPELNSTPAGCSSRPLMPCELWGEPYSSMPCMCAQCKMLAKATAAAIRQAAAAEKQAEGVQQLERCAERLADSLDSLAKTLNGIYNRMP